MGGNNMDGKRKVKRNVPKYMVRRYGGTWYWCEQLNKRRYNRSTGTDVFVDAREVVDGWRKAAIEERFALLNSTMKVRPYSTVGDVLQVYEGVPDFLMKPGRATVNKNRQVLLRLLKRSGCVDPLGVNMADLNAALLDRFFASLRPDAGAPEEERLAAFRYVSGEINKARSVFSRPMVVLYKQRGLMMPDLDEFMVHRVCDNPKKRYAMPDPEVYEPIVRAARERLAVERPSLYLAFVLVYDLGLRAMEAACMRQGWIERDDYEGVHWFVNIKGRPEEGFKPKGTEGRVPVPDAVMGVLHELAEEDYILAGNSKTERYNLVVRDLAEWMRAAGWKRHKCAHELRKLRGCFWRAQHGLEFAHEWLRHASYQVTLDSYARIPKRAEPLRLD